MRHVGRRASRLVPCIPSLSVDVRPPTLIVKSWPNVPSVDALVKSSGMPKGRVLMYRGSISRTLTLADQLGRLKK